MGKVSFLMRLGGLAAGIVLGQGSVFLLQTVLMTSGRIAITASFGFAFAVLSLVQWTADWGGLVLQGRCRSEDLSFDRIWEMALARQFVAPAILACQLSFAFFYRSTDELAAGMIMGGALIAPIWACNLAGLLDANGKNALAGPLAGLPPALAVLAGCQLLRANFHPISVGISIGAAYAVGCLLCVLGQILIARQLTPLKLPRAVSFRGARRWLVEGAVYCAGEFPAQFYGRALLLIVTKSLGLHTAGIYIYIRQIISASAQAVLLIKRVEFSALRRVATNRPLHITDVLRVQQVSLIASLSVFVGSLFGLFIHVPPSLVDVAAVLPYFSSTIPVWASAVTLGQVVVVSGRVRSYSSFMVATTTVSALLAWLLTAHFGLRFLAMLDFLGFSILILSYYSVIRSGRLA